MGRLPEHLERSAAVLPCFLLLFLLLRPCAAAGAAEAGRSAYEGYRVGAVRVSGLAFMEEAYFLDLLEMPPGTVFTPERLRKGLHRLFRKGIFRDLRAEAEEIDPEARRLVLRIRVEPYQRIRDVRFRGNDFQPYGRLSRAAGLKRGMVFRHELLASARRRVLDELRRRGFPEASVTAEARSAGSGLLDIEFRIREGAPERIRRVVVEGAGELDTARLIFGARAGQILDRVALGEDVERVWKRQRRRGYLRALRPEWSYAAGVLRVRLRAGPRYRIRFSGNTVFSSAQLLAAYPLEDLEPDFGKEIVEEVADRFRRFYRDRGYPFAQVAASYEGGEREARLDFYIFEGERVTIRDVRFQGVSLPKERLDQVLEFLGYRPGLLYSESRIEKGLDRMMALYHSLGYLRAAVVSVDRDFESVPGGVLLNVTVDEGVQTRIRRLLFAGNRAVATERLRELAGLAEGQPYNDVNVADARFRILEHYGRLGYPNAQLTVEREFSGDEKEVLLTFRVEEGARLRYGKVIVAGNLRTRDELVVRELDLPPGGVFDEREVQRGKQRLHRMGIFSGVSVETLPGADPRKDRDVLVRLEEDHFGSVDIGVGYGSFDRARGFIEIGHRNVGGLNRRVSLKGEFSSLIRRLSLNYRDPWLLLDYKLPLHARLLAEHEEVINPDSRALRYETRTLSFQTGVVRDLTPEIQVGLEYEYAFIDTYNIQPGEEPAREDTGLLGLSTITPSLSRDTRSNPFNPTRGSLNALSVRWASGLLLSESTFVKPTFQSTWYLPLVHRLVLGLSVRGGMAWTLWDTTELPLSERYFLGGSTSVRGFAEDALGPKSAEGNPVGGNAFLQYNAELRLDVWKDIGVVAFIDAGNVWRGLSELNPADVRAAWGGGLRYDTPVGPFRLDYGRKFDPEPGESTSEIYFSLGHAF